MEEGVLGYDEGGGRQNRKGTTTTRGWEERSALLRGTLSRAVLSKPVRKSSMFAVVAFFEEASRCINGYSEGARTQHRSITCEIQTKASAAKASHTRKIARTHSLEDRPREKVRLISARGLYCAIDRYSYCEAGFGTGYLKAKSSKKLLHDMMDAWNEAVAMTQAQLFSSTLLH